ncbi:unnamed protein product [Closterium sp. Naga37s-1]|nr:unnamed protein product [Closterium sp. Naga37s-1]
MDFSTDLSPSSFSKELRMRPLDSERNGQTEKWCVVEKGPQSLDLEGKPFTFDHVAGEKASQEDLFQLAGRPIVKNCLEGFNSTMFAYGQTGSGKTHTMFGAGVCKDEVEIGSEWGMIPRVVHLLFTLLEQEKQQRESEGFKFSWTCSLLQIYQDQISDLLDPTRSNLVIAEATNGVYVKDLTKKEVTTFAQVMELIQQGMEQRQTAPTNMKEESSRSHCVFTCNIESTWTAEGNKNSRSSQLNLVDLAGSEKQKQSGAEGDRLKEAISINSSLSHLGKVIMVLVGSVRENRPRPLIQSYSHLCLSHEATHSTLRFAKDVKEVCNKAVVNEAAERQPDDQQAEIARLMDELDSTIKSKQDAEADKSALNDRLKLLEQEMMELRGRFLIEEGGRRDAEQAVEEARRELREAAAALAQEKAAVADLRASLEQVREMQEERREQEGKLMELTERVIAEEGGRLDAEQAAEEARRELREAAAALAQEKAAVADLRASLEQVREIQGREERGEEERKEQEVTLQQLRERAFTEEGRRRNAEQAAEEAKRELQEAGAAAAALALENAAVKEQLRASREQVRELGPGVEEEGMQEEEEASEGLGGEEEGVSEGLGGEEEGVSEGLGGEEEGVSEKLGGEEEEGVSEGLGGEEEGVSEGLGGEKEEGVSEGLGGEEEERVSGVKKPRRKNKLFTLDEVELLVAAVEKFGIGRWVDVKDSAFATSQHRTNVDLKDKWRNLLTTKSIQLSQELLNRVKQADKYWKEQARIQQENQVGAFPTSPVFPLPFPFPHLPGLSPLLSVFPTFPTFPTYPAFPFALRWSEGAKRGAGRSSEADGMAGETNGGAVGAEGGANGGEAAECRVGAAQEEGGAGGVDDYDEEARLQQQGEVSIVAQACP